MMRDYGRERGGLDREYRTMRYDDLLEEARAKANAFRVSANQYVRNMYLALRNENPNITSEDARERIEKYLLGIWEKRTIVDALPDEAKAPIKQKSARADATLNSGYNPKSTPLRSEDDVKNTQSPRKRKPRDRLAGWLIDRVFTQLVNIRIEVKTPDGGSTIVPKYYQQAWEVLRDLFVGEVQFPYPFSIFESDISPELRSLLFNRPSKAYIVSRVVERIFENASLRLYEESKKNRIGLRYNWEFYP
jgi:hypothetical protein